MIQLNELRINNYYRYPNTKPFRLTQEDLQSHRFWEDIDIIEPIYLTSGVLQKCGFEWNEELLAYEKQRFFPLIKKPRINGSRYNLTLGTENYIIAKLWYLHELQNIFWDTGRKELEINGL